MEGAKEEMQLAQRRLAKDRAEYQRQFAESKSKLADMFGCIDTQLLEIKYLKNWSCKLNELLSMQSAADIQEEVDKRSISLVGQKEAD